MPPRHLATAGGLLLLWSSAAAAAPPSVLTLTAPVGTTQQASLPLTTTSFLAVEQQQQGGGVCNPLAGSDSIVLVEGVGSTPTLTPIATARPVVPKLRLSATRVLAQIADANGGIALLDDLGGANVYSEIVPQSGQYDIWVRLDDTSAVVTDDGLGAFLLVDLDLALPGVIPLSVPGAVQSATALTSTSFLIGSQETPGPDGFVMHYFRRSLVGDLLHKVLPVPGLPYAGPFPLSATSFVMTSLGADGVAPSPDDAVDVFRKIDGAFTRARVATPDLARGSAPERALVLEPKRALLRSAGADQTAGSADDGVLVLDRLQNKKPRASFVPVPGLRLRSFVEDLADRKNAIVVANTTPQAPPGPEDALVVLIPSGKKARAKTIGAGTLADGGAAEPIAIAPGLVAVGSPGSDGVAGSSDDEIVTLRQGQGGGALDRIVVGPLAWLADPAATRGSLTSLGPAAAAMPVDPSAAGAQLAVVGGIGGAMSVEYADTPYANPGGLHLLGNGNAALSAAWNLQGVSPCNSAIHVLSGLPDGVALRQEQVALTYTPPRGTRLSATARLTLPDPALLARSDLTVRLGPMTDAISAKDIKHQGRAYVYADPYGKKGGVRRLSYDTGSRTLRVDGWVPFDATVPAPRFVFSLESQEFQIAAWLEDATTGSATEYAEPAP